MRRLTATPMIFGLGFLLLLVGLWRVDASPERIWNGLSRLGWLFALMWPPSPGGALADLMKGLAESLAMAFLGTLIAAVVALPLALLGAGNVVGSALLRFSARRLFDGLRGIDTLIWALIFVSASRRRWKAPTAGRWKRCARPGPGGASRCGWGCCRRSRR